MSAALLFMFFVAGTVSGATGDRAATGTAGSAGGRS